MSRSRAAALELARAGLDERARRRQHAVPAAVARAAVAASGAVGPAAQPGRIGLAGRAGAIGGVEAALQAVRRVHRLERDAEVDVLPGLAAEAEQPAAQAVRA